VSPGEVGPGRLIPAGLDAAVVFLRHGESTYIAEGRFQGQAETPLSRLGERQAELAARRLAVPTRSPILPIPIRPPAEIVHSPLRRTTQTAARVAREIVDTHGTRSAPLRPDRGLIEIGQGEWEGLHRSEIESGYADLLAAWRRAPLEANAPGGERVVDVAVRVRAALAGVLERLASAGPAGDRSPTTASGYPPAPAPDTPWTLVVGHDGTFKVALLTLLDLPLERFWTFPFALCGISVVEIRSGLPVLRAHNLIEHLAPLLDERAVAKSEERQRSGAL
jgi:broad specificity phosphatase PhoE